MEAVNVGLWRVTCTAVTVGETLVQQCVDSSLTRKHLEDFKRYRGQEREEIIVNRLLTREVFSLRICRAL